MAKRPRVESDAAPLTSNPFAGLLGGEDLPDAEPAAVSPMPAETDVVDPGAGLGEALSQRLIVRRQKKGQGGKTVTCVEGLPPSTLTTLLPQLKRELGCSARVDAELLVAGTGDHNRVAQWLRGLGASRVVLGN